MKALTLIFLFSAFHFANAQNIPESELHYYLSLNSIGDNTASVQQIGNTNYAQISAKTVAVNQIGDNQQFYYTESSILPSNFSVNIEGDNSYVEIMGNNQIMDNMSIKITGDNRSVIIRNYP
ncbi:MAG: hypothetical protein ACK5IC_03640 [Moheibacter sp.]